MFSITPSSFPGQEATITNTLENPWRHRGRKFFAVCDQGRGVDGADIGQPDPALQARWGNVGNVRPGSGLGPWTIAYLKWCTRMVGVSK